MSSKFIVQHRRGTAQQWTESGVIPYDGEIVIEECSDGSFKTKIGDGVNTFPDLPYQNLDKEIYELKQYVDGKVVDGLLYEDNKLYLTLGGEIVSDPVEITGGGGGGSATTIRVTNLNDSSTFAVAAGNSALLKFNFKSLEDDIPTGDGVCTVTVNGTVKSKLNIKQGDNQIDVADYLAIGSNTVKITCADVLGMSRSLTYTITVIELNITSTFDDSILYKSDILFKYIPYGLVEKTIHFIVDGEEIANVTTSASGKQNGQTIPFMSHGVHRLEVYMTAEMNGMSMESNHLAYDIMCVEDDNETPLIASVYTVTTLTQGELVSIPYSVYDPASPTCAIELIILDNGTIYSTQSVTVDRTKQIWNTRQYPIGTISFVIKYGEYSVTHIVEVVENEIPVEPVANDLELYLSSSGRSNNEENPDIWTYNDITTIFTNMNWSSNGWIVDDSGDTCLRLNGDATAEINFKPFSSDLREYGKTIELEFAVRDVNNRDAIVINCMSGNIGIQATADRAFLESEQSLIDCRYKDEEKIRIAFVIESKSEYRLMSIYLNGILSGSLQYPSNDNFQQANPVNITIGSPYCGIDIYTIRSYSTALTSIEETNNYIADITDMGEKMELYDANNIYDEYENLSYEAIKTKIPVMTITGEMPTYKGDKKKVDVKFESPFNPELDFEESGCSIDVQGTSSQFYKRKNWKIKFANYHQHMIGEMPAKVFTMKADYAEATGTHNTQNANLIDTLYTEPIPPEEVDDKVRTTVVGFPCVIFEKATEDSEPVFAGKYNFNTDKGAENTFGFTSDYDVESWEFLNNTSDACNFKGEIPTDWSNDFEARYPEDYTDISRFKIMHDWVVSTRQDTATGDELAEQYIDIDGNTYTNDTAEYRLAKFKTEFEEHFDMHYMLIYYVYSFFALMVDQRAKNMFLTYWGTTGKFYGYYYDNDTSFGINNEGLLVFDYYHEDTDILDGANVYNGQDSTLWVNFREAFPEQIKTTYQDLRNTNKLTYDVLVDYFITNGSDKWSASIYNEDAEYKYISMLKSDNDASNLYQIRGSGEEHFRYFIENRLNYCDSKWYGPNYAKKLISLRIYTPQGEQVITPNANITITPYSNMYAGVKYRANGILQQQRAEANVPVTFIAPAETFNDTETAIYGASEISSLGDLAPLYCGSVNVSDATKLIELKIGDGTEGYINTNLKDLSIGTNKLLKKIDIQNCPNLTNSLGLSNCPNIEEIYAKGSGITGIELSKSGYLRIIQLPATIANLTLTNQLYIEQLTLEGYDAIKTIHIENCPTIDSRSIIESSPNLERLRITNVNWTCPDTEFLKSLYTIGGIDKNGINTDVAYITGTCHISTLTGSEMLDIKNHFPYLNITYDNLTANIVYMSEDGSTELYRDTIVNGGDAIDPIAEDIVDTPTKEADAQYYYTYGGWSLKSGETPNENALKNVTTDRIVYIAFNRTIRSYTIRFYNGTTLLQTLSVNYGSDAIYSGGAFQKIGVNNPELYEFIGWDPDPKAITGDMDCYAQYTFLGYINDDWATIAANVENGTYSTVYSTGKLKELTLTYSDGTTETLDVEIVGFDHDDLADGTGKAAISWIVKEVPTSTHSMNSSVTNVGGWDSSAMRSYVGNTIYNALPDEVKSMIKPVIKKTTAGGMSTDIIESVDNLWIPSIVELNSSYASDDAAYASEGEPYDVYTDTASLQKCKSDSAVTSNYWTRSAVTTYKYGFWCVYNTGEVSSSGADSSMGVAFGFCI